MKITEVIKFILVVPIISIQHILSSRACGIVKLSGARILGEGKLLRIAWVER